MTAPTQWEAKHRMHCPVHREVEETDCSDLATRDLVDNPEAMSVHVIQRRGGYNLALLLLTRHLGGTIPFWLDLKLNLVAQTCTVEEVSRGGVSAGSKHAPRTRFEVIPVRIELIGPTEVVQGMILAGVPPEEAEEIKSTGELRDWIASADPAVQVLVEALGGRSKEGHSNVLLVDNEARTIDYFEPNVDPTDPAHFEVVSRCVGSVKEWTDRHMPGYRFRSPDTVCPISGPQSMEGSGTCLLWSLFYVYYALSCPAAHEQVSSSSSSSSSGSGSHLGKRKRGISDTETAAGRDMRLLMRNSPEYLRRFIAHFGCFVWQLLRANFAEEAMFAYNAMHAYAKKTKDEDLLQFVEDLLRSGNTAVLLQTLSKDKRWETAIVDYIENMRNRKQTDQAQAAERLAVRIPRITGSVPLSNKMQDAVKCFHQLRNLHPKEAATMLDAFGNPNAALVKRFLSRRGLVVPTEDLLNRCQRILEALAPAGQP